MRLILLAFFLIFSLVASSNPAISLIENVSASSKLKGSFSEEFDYSPINLFDGDISTAWFEGRPGFSGHEEIHIGLFKPTDINKLGFINGYGKSGKLYSENGRILEATIVTDDTTSNIRLRDDPGIQWFAINSKNTKRVTIKITKIIHGKKYEDYGFSELFITEKADNKLNLNPEVIEETHNSLNHYMGLSSQNKPKLKKVSQSELASVLSKKFDKLDGAGIEERTNAFSKLLLNHPYHIPTVVRKTLNEKSIFMSLSNDIDARIYLAKIIWKDNPVQIAYLKQLPTNAYNRYYRILDLGDIRSIHKYIDIISETGIWHEHCCEKMPSELLNTLNSNKLKKIINSYKGDLNKETWNELKKVNDNGNTPSNVY